MTITQSQTSTVNLQRGLTIGALLVGVSIAAGFLGTTLLLVIVRLTSGAARGSRS